MIWFLSIISIITFCVATPIPFSEAPDLPSTFDEQTKTQTKLPDSELRMSMGILYPSEGKLLHGLNRYNLVVGIKMPDVQFELKLNNTEDRLKNFITHCKELTIIPQVVKLCYQFWSLYHTFRNQELKHQHRIQQIMCKDLPAMLPNYKPDDSLCPITLPDFDVDPDGMDPYRLMANFRSQIYSIDLTPTDNTNPNTNSSLQNNDKTELPDNNRQNRQRTRNPTRRIRYIPNPLPIRNNTHDTHDIGRSRNKRFISTLVSLAYDGFKTYITNKQNKKLFKGMKLLQKRQDVLENKIQTVHDDMLAIAKATLHDINQVRDDLHQTRVRIDHITMRLLTVEEEVRIWKGNVADNTAA